MCICKYRRKKQQVGQPHLALSLLLLFQFLWVKAIDFSVWCEAKTNPLNDNMNPYVVLGWSRPDEVWRLFPAVSPPFYVAQKHQWRLFLEAVLCLKVLPRPWCSLAAGTFMSACGGTCSGGWRRAHSHWVVPRLMLVRKRLHIAHNFRRSGSG